jgi:hypothetical protein
MAVASRDIGEVRALLRRWGIQVTVINLPTLFPYAVQYLTAVFGRNPVEQRGVDVWYGEAPQGRAGQK